MRRVEQYFSSRENMQTQDSQRIRTKLQKVKFRKMMLIMDCSSITHEKIFKENVDDAGYGPSHELQLQDPGISPGDGETRCV